MVIWYINNTFCHGNVIQPSKGTLNSPSSKTRRHLDVESWGAYILGLVNLHLIFFFDHGESLPSKIWSTVNFERTDVLLFYYFLYLKVNLDLEKTNQLGESSPNFIFAAMNLDPIVMKKSELVNLDLTILLKRWTEVKTWGG